LILANRRPAVTSATIVFVCTGNTCRSPLAMALARVRWPEATFVSAGLQAVDGQPAADPAREVARERGADLEDHRSRRLDGDLVRQADWIIGMTRSHVAMLSRALPADATARVGLLGTPGRDLRGMATPDDEEVADPIGGSQETYRTTADQLERLLDGWREAFGGPDGRPEETT
jgi:protein-tyrosine-phosphatase